MIPRPVRYRARRQPDGSPRVEFQQVDGERWFPLAAIEEGVPFGWGAGERGHIEHARHLAAALLLSRISMGEASEILDNMAALVLRMPIEGWEMPGQTLGTVIARIVAGTPIPDPAFPLSITEHRLATLFRPADVYCHACSVAGGAERGIRHAPPACGKGASSGRAE